MKLLADENVSGVLVDQLLEYDYDILWIKRFRPGASDDEVVEIASADRRVVITSDKGFGERVVRRGLPLGIILLRLQTLTPDEHVAVALRAILSRDDWDQYLSVVEPRRIRMVPLDRRTRIAPSN